MRTAPFHVNSHCRLKARISAARCRAHSIGAALTMLIGESRSLRAIISGTPMVAGIIAKALATSFGPPIVMLCVQATTHPDKVRNNSKA